MLHDLEAAGPFARLGGIGLWHEEDVGVSVAGAERLLLDAADREDAAVGGERSGDRDPAPLDEAAAKLAWERTVEFFNKTLR